MRIKTFQGRTLEEVLPMIREELGPDAVVIGQRQKVQGGVAGFFGTKVIEVTAADSMPSDDELVDLEDRMMGERSGDSTSSTTGDDDQDALAERFRSAMKMGRRGGIDVTDEWDPSQDAELAQEYGRVLEHAAAAGSFAELDVPTAAATIPVPPRAAAPEQPPAAAPAAAAAPMPDPMAQARELAARTHENVRHATERVEQASSMGTYAPPQALPQTAPPATTTFAATVAPESSQGFVPQAVPSADQAAITVDHALRTDLAMPRSTDSQLADALGAAIEGIDLSEIAALRQAVDATRRSQDLDVDQLRARSVIEQLDEQLDPIIAQLRAVGVDADVVEIIVDAAVRHRLPFGGDQDVEQVMRAVIEELIPVHTGFPLLGRAHRAAFVGPAHSGRTSVIAKVATRYAQTGMKVGVLSIVNAQPGVPVMAEPAFADLQAEIRYAISPSQAMDAMDAFAEHDVVLVDTPASTYLDPDVRGLVQSCLLAIGTDDIHVVVPLATSGREARSIVDTFRPIGANRLVVTRIDESRYVGEILNFGFRLGLPMTYLSDGPTVPEDLRAASSREITDRILQTEPKH